MLKVLKSTFGILKFTMLGSLLGLSCYILINLATLEQAYMDKYESAYNQMIREHEANVVFGILLRSQRSWERSNETVSQAYRDERTQRSNLETELEILKYETYTFYRVLENLHPGVLEDIEKQLGPRNNYFQPGPNTTELQLTPEGHHAN